MAVDENTRAGLSVVIPVYNSQEILPILLERLAPVLPQLAPEFEVVLVNDGSRDGSWAGITAMADRYPFVRGFDLMRNFGQHNALLAGIRAARFDTIVTMDDDLQHPPEEIHKLVAALTPDKDVVYAVPPKLPHSPGRNLASRLTKLVLQKAMGAEIASRVDAFRIFRTQVRQAFTNFVGTHLSLDVLLTWGTSRFGMIEVEHHPRRIGTSNYTVRKLTTHALNMMTGFSTLPLQLASWLGFGTTAFGMLVLAYVLIRVFIENAAPAGFPLLVSIISIFSGAQLVALGIMGEYLARVHTRSLDRPPYVLRGATEAGRAGEPGAR
jgi:undecaprenyl-phosphate 4-deoxy-4-formamido-L-arabinose transferase